jgi:hypothetical protein
MCQKEIHNSPCVRRHDISVEFAQRNGTEPNRCLTVKEPMNEILRGAKKTENENRCYYLSQCAQVSAASSAPIVMLFWCSDSLQDFLTICVLLFMVGNLIRTSDQAQVKVISK